MGVLARSEMHAALQAWLLLSSVSSSRFDLFVLRMKLKLSVAHRWSSFFCITIPDPFLLWLVWFDSVMPSLYPIYCYSRYRFTRYFDNGKTCFDCDFLKFHRYNRYILTTGHFIADTDCSSILLKLHHLTACVAAWLGHYVMNMPVHQAPLTASDNSFTFKKSYFLDKHKHACAHARIYIQRRRGKKMQRMWHQVTRLKHLEQHAYLQAGYVCARMWKTEYPCHHPFSAPPPSHRHPHLHHQPAEVAEHKHY